MKIQSVQSEKWQLVRGFPLFHSVFFKRLLQFFQETITIVFDEARKHGYAGIPCFVLEDGTVTLSPEEAGIQMDEARPAASCRLDGTGC